MELKRKGKIKASVKIEHRKVDENGKPATDWKVIKDFEDEDVKEVEKNEEKKS